MGSGPRQKDMLGIRNITPEKADEISELYFTCDRDRKKMGRELGLGQALDEEYLHHPLVRAAIVGKVKQMRRDRVYTREQHLAKLQEIRDGALADENWKIALQAEVQVGTAAGLYEKVGDLDPNAGALPPPENLTTDQIRERLQQMQARGLPAPEAAPPSVPQAAPLEVDTFSSERPF